jgi:hypothetical protein
MLLLAALVYVSSGVAIMTLIWRQERRADRRAEVLGLEAGRNPVGILVLVLSSAVLALFPTVIFWMLFVA